MRLFEFGDLRYSPSVYHIYLRKYLTFFYKTFGYYKLWIPDFILFIKKTSKQKYMELCSGAGDVLILIDTQLDKKELGAIKFILSDILPMPEFYNRINKLHSNNFEYLMDSVDLNNNLINYKYPKIFINSFHHFSKEQAKKIIEMNLKNGNEIIILEYVRKTFLGVIAMFFGSVVVFLTLPFIVNARHLLFMSFFTYVLPVFPIMFLWDGIVSCLHVFSEKEIIQFASELKCNVKINSNIKRSFLYPPGVSIITITYE